MAIDYAGVGWHEGERRMHSLLHVPDQENPTSRGLTPYGIHMLRTSPLLAIGTLDREGRPWTTLLGGEPGFAQYLGQSVLMGVKTVAEGMFDPVVSTLIDTLENGDIAHHEANSRIFSGLAIDLATRSRVKLSGKIIAARLEHDPAAGNRVGDLQLIAKIEESLGRPNYPSSSCTHVTGNLEILDRTFPLVQQPSLHESADTLLGADISYHQCSDQLHNATYLGTLWVERILVGKSLPSSLVPCNAVDPHSYELDY